MKKVKVNIRASQTVQYDQIIEMDEEEYMRLSSIWSSDKLAQELEKYTDTTEVTDADQMEDGEIYLEEE